MTGITDPTEEYFKDGLWGWVSNQWKKLRATADGDLIVSGSLTSFPHVLLDGSVHPDTVAGAPVKDYTIVGVDVGGGVIKWQQQAAAAATHALLDGSVHPDTVAGAPVKGDLIVGVDQGAGVIKWQRLAAAAAGGVLTVTAAGVLGYVLPHVARCSTAAGQSILNNAYTIVDYGTVLEDTHSQITTGAAWKFTCKLAGLYLVTAHVLFASTTTWADGEAAELHLYLSGAFLSVLNRRDNYNANPHYAYLHGSALVRLVLANYIDARVVQESGAALALYPSGTQNLIEIAYVCA